MLSRAASQHFGASFFYCDFGAPGVSLDLLLQGTDDRDELVEILSGARFHNQRGFYTRWRQFMEADSWTGLMPS